VDCGSRNHTILAPHITAPFLAPPVEADDGSRRVQDPTAATTTIHHRRPWRRNGRTSRDAALDAEDAETMTCAKDRSSAGLGDGVDEGGDVEVLSEAA
jgi:hypothetical protein